MESQEDKFPWSYEDDTEYWHIQMRYEDRQKIREEFLGKRKALADYTPDNPFYHRAAVSAELAAMRYDMAYIVAENKRLRNMIETIDFLHQQVGVLQGAYAHTKMLAERNKINYDMFAKGIQQVIKLKEELQNDITKRSDGAAGQES